MTMTLFAELKRRNIFRVALLYAVLAWLMVELGSIAVDYLGLPQWIYRFTCSLLVICFPLALIFSWLYEITPQGLKREFNVLPGESITAETAIRLRRITLAAVGLILLVNVLRVAFG